MRLPMVLLTCGLTLLACSKQDPPRPDPGARGTPPPPLDKTTQPGACQGGGGEVKDPVSAPFFPRKLGVFCVNPEGETQAYGEKAPAPIDGICKMFDGGCELYRTHQVKRTVSLDYVDGEGKGSTVNAILSQFATSDHAYAMFTHRVLGGEDPLRPDMPKKTEVGAPGAMGTGSLYAVKGPYLLELSYVNSEESGDEKKLKASAERHLPVVARGILEKLPGTVTPPAAVAQLPSENLLPLGVAYTLGKTLGVEGTDHSAQGFYRDGERRYRALVLLKDDPEQAKDVLKSFGKLKGAQEEKNLGEAAVRVMLQEQNDDPKAEWIVARKGRLVVGVGDDNFALKGGDAAKVSLSKDEKIKRLKTILEASK
ncbi:MAG: DUF6599 family protein [Myxococcales bacterium]|nr:hypothetical protein [Polyangiaceae bacterium]MDW8247885.1 DUF6599 family protein [Myxococcales bacterium]